MTSFPGSEVCRSEISKCGYRSVFFAKKYSLEVQSWLINDDSINSLGIPVLLVLMIE
jgi:hypothetical protein